MNKPTPAFFSLSVLIDFEHSDDFETDPNGVLGPWFEFEKLPSDLLQAYQKGVLSLADFEKRFWRLSEHSDEFWESYRVGDFEHCEELTKQISTLFE